MFHVGDKILYGCSGACMIEQITQMRFGRSLEQYFILRPLFQNTAVIYVPVNNSALVEKMREMPSREAVDCMIMHMPEAESVWIDDAQERKACYDKIMRSGNCIDLIRMIKTLSEQKRRRLSEGKNLHVSDENFLRDAQKLLFDEFAYPLELLPSQVSAYIQSKIELK